MPTTINFGGGNATSSVNSGNKKKSSISPDTWKKVAIGGVSAIAFGGAAYATTSMLSDGQAEDIEASVDGNGENEADASVEETAAPAANFNPSMQMATSVNDDMSFSEAFAAARAEVHAGGMFEWHGNVYGTYYGNEWDALSPDQQSAFTAGTSSVASQHTAPAVDDTHVAQETPVQQQETKVEVDDDDDIAEVRIERIDYDPENEVSTAYVTVDETEVIMADIDNDGVFDVMYIDENNDGLVAENEVYNITDENITVDSLGGYTEPVIDDYIEDDFLANNDVDIDSIEL